MTRTGHINFGAIDVTDRRMSGAPLLSTGRRPRRGGRHGQRRAVVHSFRLTDDHDAEPSNSLIAIEGGHNYSPSSEASPPLQGSPSGTHSRRLRWSAADSPQIPADPRHKVDPYLGIARSLRRPRDRRTRFRSCSAGSFQDVSSRRSDSPSRVANSTLANRPLATFEDSSSNDFLARDVLSLREIGKRVVLHGVRANRECHAPVIRLRYGLRALEFQDQTPPHSPAQVRAKTRRGLTRPD